MADVKELIRSAVSRAVVHSGTTAFGRRLARRNGAMILYGHRVADDDEGYLQGLRPDWLDEQLDYLTRHYEVISLSTLVKCFEQKKPVPHRSAVLTFDDGFRDNLEQAAPLLEKYRVPATIFVVTGSLTSGALPWSQRLGMLFQQTGVAEFVDWLSGDTAFDLSTEAGRHRAYLSIKAPISRMCLDERETSLDLVARSLEVEAPRDRMLSWDDARELLRMGIEIGAHTYSHPLLANIPIKEAQWEMERSMDDLRELLGIERPTFCFPGGSVSPELLQLVPALGFRSTFVPNRAIRINNLTTVDQFSLSRIGMPNRPSYILEAEMDGPLHSIRSALRTRT